MMTMIRPNPTVQIPPTWDCDDHPPYVSPLLLAALQRYLPSEDADADVLGREDDVPPVEAFLCDQFRMYEFKVRKCARGRSHDWTDCPFAHPGEKARRRDPCGFRYSGIACPDFRKGGCKKGDSCEFAHGVFECWLHPDRYRTQPCKDGLNCRRRVCFFAHTPEQLRVVSPRNVNTFDSYLAKAAGSFVSPLISLPPESPPLSPSRFGIRSSVNDLIASIRNAQIGKMKISPQLSILRPSCYPVPSTTQIKSPRYRLAVFDAWDNANSCATVEEEVPMERVESGRDLRERMYAKLSKEHSLERAVAVAEAKPGPDVGWVSGTEI